MPTMREINFPQETAMRLDARLERDCHCLGVLNDSLLLLHRNAAVGWFILVPDTDAIDWHELDDTELTTVSHQTRALSAFAKRYFRADKTNVAAIGNAVRQMHIHIIARTRHDPCWPDAVWGHLEDQRDYDMADIAGLIAALSGELGLTMMRRP